MSSTAHKLTEYQKVKAKEIIAKVILRKGTQEKATEEIEKILGVKISRQQVSYYVKALQQEWLEASQKDISTIKAEEIAELDALKDDVYEQWERSKEKAQTTISGSTDKGSFTSDKEETRTGDPAYINNLIKISERKAKLLGLDTPIKQEVSLSQFAPEKPLEQMTDDELREYERRLLAIKNSSEKGKG